MWQFVLFTFLYNRTDTILFKMSSSSYSYTNDQTVPVPDASEMRFGIIVTEWNNNITDKLLEGAIKELKTYGASEQNITIKRVPGSFELIYAANQLSKFGHVNCIIIIGCVIRGDTPHFDYICQGVTQGIAELNAKSDIPIIFGLLTVNNEAQALERTNGKLGNKGKEYAHTAIKMINYAWDLQR